MAIDTLASLIDQLAGCGLLDAAQTRQLAQRRGRPGDPRALAKELVQRGWLTPYQINQVFHGHGKDLVLGHYVILERIGEGGMGQVFKARHQPLGRVVALKVIRKEHLADKEAMARFRREIQASAQLSHANVVRTLDADQVGDAHFMTMEFVDGADLARMVKERGPLPVLEACDYIRQTALGLQHAHEHRLVHRDIKPSNLLVAKPTGSGPWGTLKILDLGVVRGVQTLNVEDPTMLTQIGAVVGTPDFMAPEQARDARLVDIRSDLYSLGCTFYFLLTGQIPFPGETTTEKLIKSYMEEPRPLRAVRPDVPANVVAVVQKLMAKKPEDRYQTPGQVAVVLGNILARRTAWPWTRWLVSVAKRRPRAGVLRNLVRTRGRRLAAGIGAALVLLLIVGLAAGLLGRGGPGEDKIRATTLEPRRSPLDDLTAQAIPPELRVPGQPKEVVAVLGDLQGRHLGHVNAVAVSPDGKLIAAAAPGGVHFWDRAALKEVMTLREDGRTTAVAFGPLGRAFATGSTDGNVRVYDFSTAKPRLRSVLPTSRNTTVHSVAFAPDGQTLASGGSDSTVRLWDMKNLDKPESIAVLKEHIGPVTVVAFAGDGHTLASGSAGKDLSIRLWDLEDSPPAEKAVLTGHSFWINALAFHPKANLLVSGSNSALVRMWNPAEGKAAEREVLTKHGSTVRSIAFSSDGKLLVIGGGPQIQLFEAQGSEWKERTALRGTLKECSALAFVPQTHVLVCGGEHRIQIWDLESATPRELFVKPAVDARSVAFAPDGTLAAGGWDGRIHLWEFGGPEPKPVLVQPGHNYRIPHLHFAADGKVLVSAGLDGNLHVWDREAKLTDRILLSIPVAVGNPAAVDRDGKLLATAVSRRQVKLWDLAKGKPAEAGDVPSPGTDDSLAAVALSPDGRLLATADDDNLVRIYETARPPRQIASFPASKGVPTALAFSPTGQTLVLGANSGALRLWDISGMQARERPPFPFLQSYGSIHSLAFSQDGETLAVGYSNHLVLYEARTQKQLREWPWQGPVEDLAFAPAGRHLAVVNSNGTIFILRLAPPPR